MSYTVDERPVLQKPKSATLRLTFKHSVLIACTIVSAYVLMVMYPLTRLFGHDELFTFYIAQAPTFARMMEGIQTLDLNPPLFYLIVRWFQHFFGTGEVATRMPSSILFFFASVAFIEFLSRRVGLLWASASVVLFWCSAYFQYSTEVRPYGMLLAFFSLALLSWDTAAKNQNRGFALAGVFLGVAGMMLSHFFGIFSVGPLLLAELVRTVRLRRIDWGLCAVLLLPLAAGFGFVLLTQKPTQIHSFEVGAFPERFQGGPRKVAVFFAKLAIGVAVPFAAACLVAFAARWRVKDSPKQTAAFAWEDYGLFVGMLLPVLLINFILMRSHGAFFERYCLNSALAACVGAVLLLGALTGFRRLGGALVLGVLVCAGVASYFVPPAIGRIKRSEPGAFDNIKPELPLVAASGLTFLEMDHYEHSGLVRRLYFVTDRKAAIAYAHATIFEGMQAEKRYFPMRANVESYEDFTALYRHFLVLGTMTFPEDWLLRKLAYEGAEVKQIGRDETVAYKDHDLYEIFIPADSRALQP